MEFRELNPNAKIPVIVDHDSYHGQPHVVFESGAILLYLAGKTGKFIPKDLRGQVQCLEWVNWQMGGLGPMLGQNHHFSLYAPEKIPYAIDRYVKETNRLYAVLDKRLAGRNFILGKQYSIADMAAYPWINPDRQGQDIDDFPNVKRWKAAIRARPATGRAYAWTQKVNPNAGGIRTEAERRILFGQDRSVVK
jgi:GST-like protein